jgi:mono/diheme cytochrome c family protein
MKKIYVFAGVAILAMGLTYCSSSKKAAKAEAKAAAAAPKTTYTANVSTVIAGNCAPCHISGKGNKKPYDNYANVKADIDDIIHRIELNPTDKGFMPFKKTEKLPADVIAIFKKFKEDGALEN